MRWVGHVDASRHEKYTNILIGKPEGKTPVGRRRCRWEDNTKVDLRKIDLGALDCIYLVQDKDLWRAVVNTVMNLRVP
jgi:hypothetical protein